MGTTFLKLTNRVLDRLNEVNLNQDNFGTARGVHAATKAAVLDAVQKINKNPFQWVFTTASANQLLTPGVNEYSWPTGFKNADWSSFVLLRDDGLNINNTTLSKINREEWYHYWRTLDLNLTTAGRAPPTMVFESHGVGFGVTPAPDKAYTISYRYFKHQAELVNYNDECNIPSEYDYVIIAGALYLMKLFKEDTDGVSIMKNEFKEGLSEMRNLLLNRVDTLRDYRVHRYSTARRGFF